MRRRARRLTHTKLGIAAAALACSALPATAGAESLGTAGGLKYVRASTTIPAVGMGLTSAEKTTQCGSGRELVGGGASVTGTPQGSYLGGTRGESENSWLAIGWHLGEPDRKLTAFGVCTKRNVKEDASAGPIAQAQSSASHSVTCPSGEATGGGVVGIGSNFDFFVNSTWPADSDTWNAWVAHVDGPATTIRTGVQCLRNADLASPERDRNLAIASNGSLTTKCAGTRHVTGGGGYLTGNSEEAHLVASRPVDLGDADAVPDDGWKVKASNTTGPAKTLLSYAICMA